MEVKRKQSSPNFPKNEHFLPPDRHTYRQNVPFQRQNVTLARMVLPMD